MRLRLAHLFPFDLSDSVRTLAPSSSHNAVPLDGELRARGAIHSGSSSSIRECHLVACARTRRRSRVSRSVLPVPLPFPLSFTSPSVRIARVGCSHRPPESGRRRSPILQPPHNSPSTLSAFAARPRLTSRSLSSMGSRPSIGTASRQSPE